MNPSLSSYEVYIFLHKISVHVHCPESIHTNYQRNNLVFRQMNLSFITSDWGMSFMKCYWLCLLKCPFLITSSYLLWETTKLYVHFKAPGKLSKKWKWKGFCGSSFYLGNGEGYLYILLLITELKWFFLYDIIKHNEEKIIGESINKYSVGYMILWKRGVICY